MEKVEKIDKKIPNKDKVARLIILAQTNWERGRITQSAAEMAYYLLLSLMPILLVIANVIPLLPIEAADVMNIIQDTFPRDIFSMIEPIIEGYLDSASGGAISIGLLAAIWSASKVFQTLRRVLDDVYGSVQKKNFIIARILSLVLMIVMLLIIGLAIFVFVFGEYILNFFSTNIGFNIPFIQEFLILRWVILIFILFGEFFIVFQYVPNHHLTAKYSWPGALFTTVGWIVLTQGFSIYIALTGDDVANAAFGSFIALMLFLFLSGIVVLLGALINAMLFEWKHGQSVPEYEHEKMELEAMEESGWSGYPDEKNIVILKRKLYKVSLKEQPESYQPVDTSVNESDGKSAVHSNDEENQSSSGNVDPND